MGNTRDVGSMLRTEVKVDGSLEKVSLVLFQATFFPAFRGKRIVVMWEKQLSNQMRQLMQRFTPAP